MGIDQPKKSNPTVFVIFGAAGDLTKRKIVPSLFNLFKGQYLPEKFAVIGVDRAEVTQDALVQSYLEWIGDKDETKKKEFGSLISYFKGDFKNLDSYKSLGKLISEITQKWQVQSDRIYYLATPPSMFGVIPQYLHDANLTNDEAHDRIVIEKPFGYNYESAETLNKALMKCAKESQIFRIDHYLGKNTVRNILAFRFANPMFEPIWNRRYINRVNITVSETVGVEERGGYYEGAGALRDMVQNHLMQLLCLIALEPINNFGADEVRNKKLDVLNAVRIYSEEEVSKYVVRGQYGPGTIDGKEMIAYRSEKMVSPQSNTETFVALKLFIDNWRWQGVPFYLRTGKHLAEHKSEIELIFRDVPHQAYPKELFSNSGPARMILHIQPKEGIIIKFYAKKPGYQLDLEMVNMKFGYQETFKAPSEEAYETLIWDVIVNDPTLFMRFDQVEAAWKVVMPILNAWSKYPPPQFPNYASGSLGPKEADTL